MTSPGRSFGAVEASFSHRTTRHYSVSPDSSMEVGIPTGARASAPGAACELQSAGAMLE